MKELGENSINEHEEIIHSALQADFVLLYGEDFFEAAQRFTSQKIISFDDKQKLVNYIKANFNEAAILIKGSRGCAMETIINQLAEHE
jgi:UDP-N-acetylmuramyl pentapeptide synthase